jgi:hypothetical protein
MTEGWAIIFAAMTARPNLFLISSEITVMLLGGFLILLSLTRTVGIPATPAVMILLGILLVYWALRAWMRKEPASARLLTHIRAGSLAMVGLLLITMPLVPRGYANLIVTLAGTVLVVRGLLSGLLGLRRA